MAETSARRRFLGGLTSAMVLPAARAKSPIELQVLYEEVPPYAMLDREGRPHGYSVELVEELLKRARVSSRFEFSSWARIYRRGQTEPNVMVALMARLREREALFHWIGVAALRQGYLFRLRARGDIRMSDLAAAKAYTVAVIKDDVAERELLALGFELGRHLDRSGDYGAMFRKFFAQRIDLIALNAAVAPSQLQQYGYDPRLVEPVQKFSEASLCVALSLGSSTALRLSLEQAWESMRRDGTVGRLAAMYPVIAPD